MNTTIRNLETVDPRRRKRALALLGEAAALLTALAAGVVFGAVQLELTQLWSAIGKGQWTENTRILYHIRIPRVFTAALAGMNLALSGCILQGILRNPLADPGVVGVSAGASVFAMLVMVLFPEQAMLVPPAAFFGAMAAAGLVFLLAWERGVHPLRLILAGVAVAAFFGGVMSAIMVFHADKVQGTVNWLAGGFQGRSWNHVTMILPYSIIGVASAFWGYRYLNILQLGDETAKSIGTRVERVRFFFVALAALLAASAVSVAGMLGFVGLIVPHMVRMVVGSDFGYLLPCSAIFGAALVAGADTAARTAFAPVEIPVGVFMAFLGAPFFLYLLKRGMRRK